MIRVQDLIDAIEEEASTLADDMLLKADANGDKAFEYGVTCGLYRGLKHAIAVIEEKLKDEEDDEDNG